MNLTRLALIVLLGSAAGCSSKKSTATAQPEASVAADADDDTSSEDAFGSPTGQDSGPPTQPHDAGFPTDDGGSPCDQLEAMVVMLQNAAQACSPGVPQQCTGQATGTCCPISVDTGADPAAVADFEQAVTQYQAMCSPKCSLPTCPPLQRACGTGGTCQ